MPQHFILERRAGICFALTLEVSYIVLGTECL